MYGPPRRSHVGMPQKLWGYGSKSHRHVLKYPKIQVRRLILTEMLTVAKKKVKFWFTTLNANHKELLHALTSRQKSR